MSSSILPASLAGARPNRHARRAAVAGVRPPATVQTFANMPSNRDRQPLPSTMPVQVGLNVGHNGTHVVLIVLVNDRQLPIPFEPDQAEQLIDAIGKSIDDVRAILEPPLSPEQQALLDESIAKTSTPAVDANPFKIDDETLAENQRHAIEAAVDAFGAAVVAIDRVHASFRHANHLENWCNKHGVEVDKTYDGEGYVRFVPALPVVADAVCDSPTDVSPYEEPNSEAITPSPADCPPGVVYHE